MKGDNMVKNDFLVELAFNITLMFWPLHFQTSINIFYSKINWIRLVFHAAFKSLKNFFESFGNSSAMFLLC